MDGACVFGRDEGMARFDRAKEWSGVGASMGFVPFLSGVGHGVGSGGHLVHDGGQGDFGRLAAGDQALVEKARMTGMCRQADREAM